MDISTKLPDYLTPEKMWNVYENMTEKELAQQHTILSKNFLTVFQRWKKTQDTSQNSRALEYVNRIHVIESIFESRGFKLGDGQSKWGTFDAFYHRMIRASTGFFDHIVPEKSKGLFNQILKLASLPTLAVRNDETEGNKQKFDVAIAEHLESKEVNLASQSYQYYHLETGTEITYFHPKIGYNQIFAFFMEFALKAGYPSVMIRSEDTRLGRMCTTIIFRKPLDQVVTEIKQLQQKNPSIPCNPLDNFEKENWPKTGLSEKECGELKRKQQGIFAPIQQAISTNLKEWNLWAAHLCSSEELRTIYAEQDKYIARGDYIFLYHRSAQELDVSTHPDFSRCTQLYFATAVPVNPSGNISEENSQKFVKELQCSSDVTEEKKNTENKHQASNQEDLNNQTENKQLVNNQKELGLSITNEEV